MNPDQGALDVTVARFALDFLRELGFRYAEEDDRYYYERDRVLTRHAVLAAMDRAQHD